ncbi:MAG: hypothetical protein GU347_02680 [Desulfurococcales archaeon]|jgi:hypothetical protein|uniref:Uncharacterized protein n=1 Tax=Fervidicoccus fontis TaxID=683846 RepID=A0A7J3SL81_9CREN|nr:hypothetical protein [Thermoprotei archaeon]NAY89608.1 hypothetical protein [Desulfurococcales archaeon]
MDEECEYPPCLHVVADDRRKRFAIFFEDSEGIIIWLEKEKLDEAMKKISELTKKGYQEEKDLDRIDELARTKLSAELEEEEE